jgi:tRNA pseudouridine55 synthase
VSEEQIRQVADGFVGAIEQIPPMVSAVKVGGERLYKKARRGEEVDRPPRTVTIYNLEIERVDVPDIALHVRCSSGTFIRSLVADMGDRLGCGAHLKSLRRTEAAGFSIDEAVALDDVGREHLRPLSDAVKSLDRIEVDAATAARVAHGQRLPLSGAESLEQDEAVALLSGTDLVAVYKRRDDALVPDRVLVGGDA